MSKTQVIKLTVNSKEYELDIPPNMTLLSILREIIGLTGTKEACGKGGCGACTVLMNGMPVNACIVLGVRAANCEITTIEGLAKGTELHPIQRAFIEEGAVQCGYCTPGMILSTKALLENNLYPTNEEIKRGLDGNLCRCTGYVKIINAVAKASHLLQR